ncbi:MAG TPA: hypothetical protein VLH75_00350 [Longimicrobiales bacterium]|nr:hypothetical protein [Longimicrobiales bacterium]
MNGIFKWSQVSGPLLLGVAVALAGCEAPTAPAASAPMLAEQAPSLAKTDGVRPSVTPDCGGTTVPDGRALCLADVNVKHGNASGLPVNLTGVRNGKNNGAELTVSVLGTTKFDLSKVDLGSLRLGDAGTNPPETPLTVLKSGKYQASIVDLNGDGILDLMLHFNLATMVAKGDISESTTKLCLYGEGPGYVLNGCGIGGGTGSGGGDPYEGLRKCSEDGIVVDRQKPGTRCVVIQRYAAQDLTAGLEAVVVQYENPLLPRGILISDPNQAYPGWMTTSAADLLANPAIRAPLTDGQPVTGDVRWSSQRLPLGTDNTNGAVFLGPVCRLTPSAYRWWNKNVLLVREDISIPAGATNVRVEFVVDDRARLYFNTKELTSDWVPGVTNGGCVNYDQPKTESVADRDLSADGVNRFGIWADDYGGYVNYLDFRVLADVPIYP